MPRKKFDKLIQQVEGKTPQLAVLIDPDKFNEALILMANRSRVSCFLIGGSQLNKGNLKHTVSRIKSLSSIPILLFPGDETQLSKEADGLLLLSLLSGRNPDYLIGKHVLAAREIKNMKLPVLSTAYLLIASKGQSSTQKVSKTKPLDPENTELILNTALAAEQLGFKAVYLEAGSGTKQPISAALIRAMKRTVQIPVFVGGGLDSKTKVNAAIRAGANLVVIGNALEKNIAFLNEISGCFEGGASKRIKKTKA
ncbi:MAG: geranylgeranylglyceryl/heptaprenylglyceryl phosphate synthase [Bacteroidia bacterium]|nr:geranylgeranylglyceryl/heptaprenylglyceryl phosphate synthase [Bacteroidia bacterium]